MQTKRIKCPNCGVILDVKNSHDETERLITCPGCKILLKVNFKISEPLEAHTYYAPQVNHNSTVTQLAQPLKKHSSLRLIYENHTYSLRMGINKVGRKSNSSVADIQIETNDRYMSRQHAIINVVRMTDDGLKVTLKNDQNKNQTVVNGQVVENGDEIRLTDGNNIVMGQTTILFKSED